MKDLDKAKNIFRKNYSGLKVKDYLNGVIDSRNIFAFIVANSPILEVVVIDVDSGENNIIDGLMAGALLDYLKENKR